MPEFRPALLLAATAAVIVTAALAGCSSSASDNSPGAGDEASSSSSPTAESDDSGAAASGSSLVAFDGDCPDGFLDEVLYADGFSSEEPHHVPWVEIAPSAFGYPVSPEAQSGCFYAYDRGDVVIYEAVIPGISAATVTAPLVAAGWTDFRDGTLGSPDGRAGQAVEYPDAEAATVERKVPYSTFFSGPLLLLTT